MGAIWKALVPDPSAALTAAFPDIMADLLKVCVCVWCGGCGGAMCAMLCAGCHWFVYLVAFLVWLVRACTLTQVYHKCTTQQPVPLARYTHCQTHALIAAVYGTFHHAAVSGAGRASVAQPSGGMWRAGRPGPG